jgi:multidrug efflux pump subunit AcrA (membrane-fusion protein)
MDIPVAPDPRRHTRRYWLGGAIALGVLGLFLVAHVGPASPRIARDRVVIDTAVRGDLVRSIRGTGILVPEEQMLIAAIASGRVDRRVVEPGAMVDSGDVLLVMSNPEVDLQLLEAERSLAEARLARQRLTASHELDQLSAQDGLVSLRAQAGEATRQERVTAALADSQWVSEVEAANASEKAMALRGRIVIAERRLAVADSTFRTELAAQDEEIRRVEQVAAFHRDRVAALEVRTGVAGIVQELPAEQGEWIMGGQLLARVFRPGRLRAEVQVDEARGGEITAGQPATIIIRGDSIAGRVRRVRPAAAGGTVMVEVALLDSLPATARPDLNIEAVIETGRLSDVVHLRRPAGAIAGQRVGLYRLEHDGGGVRVSVMLGEGSTDRVAVLDGAEAGEVFIVSDVGVANGAERIRIRD